MTWVPNVQGDLPSQRYISREITLSSFAPSEEEESSDVTSARHLWLVHVNKCACEVRKLLFVIALSLFVIFYLVCYIHEYTEINLWMA